MQHNHLRSAAHRATELEDLFNSAFYPPFATRLTGGATEPLYMPRNKNVNNGEARIYYREDYYASALHEIAHWCIAGRRRLEQIDFGYWYIPDGRTAEQQVLFEQVEQKPQALEWLFSLAAGYVFNPSLDNLDGDAGDQNRRGNAFVRGIQEQVLKYIDSGVPSRAEQFMHVLADYYQQDISRSCLLNAVKSYEY